MVCPRGHHRDLGTNVLHPRHGQQFLPRDDHDIVFIRGRGGPLLGMGVVREYPTNWVRFVIYRENSVLRSANSGGQMPPLTQVPDLG